MNSKKLISFRKTKQKSLKQMADIIGVSPSYYEKIEYGDRNPSFNFMMKFKTCFPDADIEDIFLQQSTQNV